MSNKLFENRVSVGLCAIVLASLVSPKVPALAQVRFTDTFDGDLSGWNLAGADGISIRDSGSAEHGPVMVLEANGSARALVADSHKWGPVRFELDVLFPDDKDNYLGIIYNFSESKSGGHRREDFGSLYIKGNGSYIRANPWRDGNVSRLLYEEYKTPLQGNDAIAIGIWRRVKAEVVGTICHLYVGDMATPKITFGLYEGDSGQVGVNPRVAGWPVWIDNVRVTSIEGLTYDGPDIPTIDYEPEALLTDWEVQGPFEQPVPAIEEGELNDGWRPFETDPRGAVITGRVTEYAGPRPVAYFRTVLDSESDREVLLHVSTTDELSLWLNGEFLGFNYRNGYVFGDRDWNAWWDFSHNPEHEAAKDTIDLRAGKNELVLRVRNGQFASGGFFAAIEELEP